MLVIYVLSYIVYEIRTPACYDILVAGLPNQTESKNNQLAATSQIIPMPGYTPPHIPSCHYIIIIACPRTLNIQNPNSRLRLNKHIH